MHIFRARRALCAAGVLAFGLMAAGFACAAQNTETAYHKESKIMTQAPALPAAEQLSAKQQAIALIGAFAAAGNLPKLDAALNRGLDNGLTVSEAKEILVQIYAYAGFPRSLNALNELMRQTEARKQRGIADTEGRAPQKPIPAGEELTAAGKANQTKISGAPVQGPLFDFAPVINQFLQTHLFGDIFERDNLDWQSRELATLGALSAMAGVGSQLKSHMAAALRVGLTEAQLRLLPQVLAASGDAESAERARQALTQIAAASAAKP